jgi:hypothetical protein
MSATAVRSTPRYAFLPLTLKGGFMLGRADEGKRGYSLMPTYGVFSTFQTAQGVANQLNEGIGLEPNQAAQIVSRAGKRA